ncbi:13907_t:CDS:2, partial [Racocetra fulgida]
LAYLRGYVMLYPNYKDSISFTTNYAEYGVHFHFKGEEKNQWLLPLMKEDILLEGLPDGHLPNFEDLPTMDLWGYLVSPSELIQPNHRVDNTKSSIDNNKNDFIY